MNKNIKGGIIAAFLLLLGVTVAKAFKNGKIGKITNNMKNYDDELTVSGYNTKYGKRINNTIATYSHNNPGALMWYGDNWQGMDTAKTEKTKMIYFTEPGAGARAQVITLLSYYRKHGLKNINDIMHRYAPTSENNTKAYVDWLSQRMGVGSDADLRLPENRQTLARLAYFIHIYEAGFAWLDLSVFVEQAVNAK